MRQKPIRRGSKAAKKLKIIKTGVGHKKHI
jgi:hypothetical protein